MSRQKIVIIGGGTVEHVRSHLALAAPAYGKTAVTLAHYCVKQITGMDIRLYLTRMAGGEPYEELHFNYLESPGDVSEFLDCLVADQSVKILFFPVAIVDWNLTIHDGVVNGKYYPRPDSSVSKEYTAKLTLADKIIKKIRKDRKDLFLVGFKQTVGLSADEQYVRGLQLCKAASCNLVFANDSESRLNMVITPEEARYHVTHDREAALSGLVAMAKSRSNLTYTRSLVVDGQLVPWNSPDVPESLRTVVNWCIGQGAYKSFLGATAGHFAAKVDDRTFLTSQRRTNFNNLSEIGLVKVVTDGPDKVIAYGAKPSVGGQSQRLIFQNHPEMDCIVHFHCPRRSGSAVPVRSQYEFECGSHECGKNTSDGLVQFGNLKAVYLDHHGPNIVFNRSIDPQEVISFIRENFDLAEKTGGPVELVDAA